MIIFFTYLISFLYDWIFAVRNIQFPWSFIGLLTFVSEPLVMNIDPCFGLHAARTVVHHFLSVGAEFSSSLVEHITLVTVNVPENGTF